MQGQIESNRQLTQQCINETKRRIIQTDGMNKRLQIAEIKLDVIDHQKLKQSIFEEKMKTIDFSFKNLEQKWRENEEVLQNSIDYLLRYSWQIARNQVHKALNKVTRPLQMKDLFFDAVPMEEVKAAEEALKLRNERFIQDFKNS